MCNTLFFKKINTLILQNILMDQKRRQLKEKYIKITWNILTIWENLDYI